MQIVGEGDSYTFGSFLEAARSIAYRLQTEGLEFGDRIALIGENHPSWAISYLGVLYRGAVCVPLDPHGEIETITNFLENSEAKLAFIGIEFKEKFKLILERLGRHIPAVVWDKDSDREADRFPRSLTEENGFRSFDDWAATDYPQAYAAEAPRPEGNDLALLIYTSGTTGMPKGVPLTHGNILAELDGINEIVKLTDKDSILSLLPLFHAYLQIVNLWVATTYGCQAGYLKELSPAELSGAMTEFKPTILTTVPRLWYLFHKKIFDAVEAKPKAVQLLFRAMLKTNGFSRDLLNINLGRTLFGKVHDGFGGNLRLAISAGSRFDEDVARDFHRLGFTIIQGYGLTETSGAATATYEKDNRIGSVGKPMFNAEIKIDAPDDQGVGEVLIRGEMVFDGYYKNPAATAEAFTEDGWFRSGDLGRFDKDGHLYIVGRAKDVIVLPSGKNVHPEDLEVHYLKAPEVEELAVLGVADEAESRAGAEKLIAVVVPDFEYLKHEKIANSKEAIRYALDNLGRELPEYQRVRDYIVRAEPLPRTATRKIKRFQLKKELENGDLAASLPEKKTWELNDTDTSLLASPISRTVIDAVRQHAKEIETINPKMNLEIDLGLDSLARAEVFAALEHAFETEFTAEQAAAAITIENVIELVRSTPKGAEIANSSSDVELRADLNWSAIVRDAGDDLPEVRNVLRNRWFFPAFAFFVYRCFNLFCRVFMRLEVEGIDRISALAAREEDKSGHSGLAPFIICPNHQSFLDPFVLCSNYPFHIFRNIFHVGAKMFFETAAMRFLAKLLNVVPIDQDTQLMRAMKAGAIGLKHGKILNIYPEGERAFDGELHDFKKGAAILATELDLPIVPVAMDGLYKVWARRSRRIRPAKVKVRIGKPFYPRELLTEETPSEEKYEIVTAHIKDTIASMIEEMRDSRSNG